MVEVNNNLEGRLIANLEKVVEELGIYSEKNPNGKIVSIYTFGSHNTQERNEASDIDVTVVFREKYLAVRKSREGIIEFLKPFAEEGIELWMANEKQYRNPAKYMNGQPPIFHSIEGQDELCGTLMFYQHLSNPRTLYGKDIKDLTGELPELDPLDGFDYITVVEKNLAKGLFGRSQQAAIPAWLGIPKDRKELTAEELEEAEKYVDAFNSYFEKRRDIPKSKLEDKLSEEEKLVRSYVIGKDNGIAKAVLRAFHGLHILFGGEILGPYEDIRSEVAGGSLLNKIESKVSQNALQSLGCSKKDWKGHLRELAEECYEIKVNKDERGGREYSKFLEWNWTVDMPQTNSGHVGRFRDFFEFAKSVAHAEAFERGYFWTPEYYDKLKDHSRRTSFPLVNLICNDPKLNWNFVEPFIDTVISYLRDYGSFEHMIPEDERVEVRDKAVKLLEEIVSITGAPEVTVDLGKRKKGGLPIGDLKKGKIYSALADARGDEWNHRKAAGYFRGLLNSSGFDSRSPLSNSLEKDLMHAEVCIELAHSLDQLGEGEAAAKLTKVSIAMNPYSPEAVALAKTHLGLTEQSRRNFFSRIVKVNMRQIDQRVIELRRSFS